MKKSVVVILFALILAGSYLGWVSTTSERIETRSRHDVSKTIDPLPSWNEGEAKTAIIKYVKEVTKEGSENYIPPAERIATFDQDGTLWVEKPYAPEMYFAADRIKALAKDHPQWNDTEPFQSVLKDNLEPFDNLKNLEDLVFASHAGMSVSEFHHIVEEWITTAKHPRYKRLYTELVYQPMLEVLQLFQKNGFKTYIVSGGGQEFIRVYAENTYQIPPEQIVGTAEAINFEYRDGQPILFRLPKLLYFDEGKGKPESIHLIIGRRPVAAFGNSNGDKQMLEWAQAGKTRNLELLVHHDDGEREYAYGAEAKLGTFSEALMEEAQKNGWIVVSMKNDWKVLFPWELKAQTER